MKFVEYLKDRKAWKLALPLAGLSAGIAYFGVRFDPPSNPPPPAYYILLGAFGIAYSVGTIVYEARYRRDSEHRKHHESSSPASCSVHCSTDDEVIYKA